MVVNARSTWRCEYGCCCLVAQADGKARDTERRTLKRRERQTWKAEEAR